MFGNGKQDEPTQTDGQQTAVGGSGQSEPVMGQPFNMTSSQAPDLTTSPDGPTSAPVTDEPTVTPDNEDTTAAEPDAPTATDSISSDESTDVSLPPVPDADSSTTASADQPSADDLSSIKQQAMQQLAPLVGHLDQTPEEKFRTTMMMIQAADDQTLVKTAYEAAGQIKDEKERAQALLDVINEINYFTQQKKDS